MTATATAQIANASDPLYWIPRFGKDQSKAIKRLEDLVKQLQAQQGDRDEALLAAVQKLVSLPRVTIVSFLNTSCDAVSDCFIFGAMCSCKKRCPSEQDPISTPKS